MSAPYYDYDLLVVGDDSPAELLLQLAAAFELSVRQVSADSVRFRSTHQVELLSSQRTQKIVEERFTSAAIVLAMGGRSRKAPWAVPHDKLFYPEQLTPHICKSLPSPVLVAGAGQLGRDCVDELSRHDQVVYWCDGEIGEMCTSKIAQQAVMTIPEDILSVTVSGQKLSVLTDQCQELCVNAIVSCLGVVGNTDQFDLAPLGLDVDDNAKLWCNEHAETWTKNVFAIGTVVGYPSPQADAHTLCQAILERVYERKQSANSPAVSSA